VKDVFIALLVLAKNKGATHVTSCLCTSQEDSSDKANHGGSNRDSELHAHQNPTDTMTDGKRSS
jgi:hypothetical protein